MSKKKSNKKQKIKQNLFVVFSYKNFKQQFFTKHKKNQQKSKKIIISKLNYIIHKENEISAKR